MEQHLEELGARSAVVRTVLEMTRHEPFTDADRARIAFRALLEHRHNLLRQILARRENWHFARVAWPVRDVAAQAAVLGKLHAEVERMEEALGALCGAVERRAA